MNKKDLASFLTAGASGPNQFVDRDTQTGLADKKAASDQAMQELLYGKQTPAQTQTIPGKDVELPGPTQTGGPLTGRTPDQTVTTPASYQPGIHAQSAIAEQVGKNAANLDTLKSPEFQNQVNQGGSAKAGDLSVGADPTVKLIGVADKGEENARQKAIANYNHALPKLQGVYQAASEGMDLTNDPKNPGSLGQARTLMLKSMGMNRYNEQEAKAVLPPSLYGTISTLFNAAGGDATPLNEAQRATINQFFQNQLHQTKQQHDQLKQSSLDTYNMSRYAAPSGQQRLQSTMGGSFDKALSDADQRYQQVPTTGGPNLTSAPQPGIVDKLKSFFHGGSPAPQQAPAAPQMTFEQFKAAKKAGKL